MKITVDTNVLLRAAVRDDTGQAKTAIEAMKAADAVAISLPALCEFAWVLQRHYGITRRDVGDAIRQLIENEKVIVPRLAVEAGLSVLAQGGDFADGVIAQEGAELGGDVFVSFDRKAIRALTRQGRSTRLLTSGP